MERLLLDSHMVLWWDSDVTRLSDRQRAAIEEPSHQVYVSAATAWELGIKQASGKLVLSGSIQELVRRSGFLELPITMKHAEKAAALPLHHKDPFDRVLVAQAIEEGLTLVTVDRRLADYGVAVLVG